MLIEIHAIQNHSPANLNRDDLGAPKTCYFGGVLRSRISSQCIKRSIRMSKEFERLLGGVRTRQLARLISEALGGSEEEMQKTQKKVESILKICGIEPRKSRKKSGDEENEESEKSKMLVYTTREAIREMASLLQQNGANTDEELADRFGGLISKKTAAPDMALAGRMLEPDKSAKKIWKKLDTTVEAALQAAHAISTHEARPEVDYYVAADDVPGDDAGAGYVDEAMFASACFYKYFSIHWETLVENLKGFQGNKEHLAAHTVGAFIRAAALTNPTGKQNSFAAHNPPDGILIEIKDTPVSYANAFAKPVDVNDRDMVSQSIAQLGQYIHDLDTGYGKPQKRFWFSPNLRYPLKVQVKEGENGKEKKVEVLLAENNVESLDELIALVLDAVGDGYNWEEVQKSFVNPEATP